MLRRNQGEKNGSHFWSGVKKILPDADRPATGPAGDNERTDFEENRGWRSVEEFSPTEAGCAGSPEDPYAHNPEEILLAKEANGNGQDRADHDNGTTADKALPVAEDQGSEAADKNFGNPTYGSKSENIESEDSVAQSSGNGSGSVQDRPPFGRSPRKLPWWKSWYGNREVGLLASDQEERKRRNDWNGSLDDSHGKRGRRLPGPSGDRETIRKPPDN